MGKSVREDEMKSCLVVDASKVVRTVARRILEELDFSVDEAEDGQIALDACSVSNSARLEYARHEWPGFSKGAP